MGQSLERVAREQVDWADLIGPAEWRRIVALLGLSAGQAQFLWYALHDPREAAIAERMALTAHGAHAHRMAVFRKLRVDRMPAAIARVFAAYIRTRNVAVRDLAEQPGDRRDYLDR